MVAASIWSLLLPAMEQVSWMGKLSFLPAAIGFWIGVLFLLLLDHIIHTSILEVMPPRVRKASAAHHNDGACRNAPQHSGRYGSRCRLCRISLRKHTNHLYRRTCALHWHCHSELSGGRNHLDAPARRGHKKGRAFTGGVLSGIVEPIGAVLTILAAHYLVPALPYLLSFAAGAMLYVVVEELIPEMSEGNHSNIGTIFFAVGFAIMMVLDTALG